MELKSYGHYGRPVLAFPSESGSAWDWEHHGMVDALGGLLAAGRLRLFTVDAADGATWSDRSLPLEERARRHEHYEGWIVGEVVPHIHDLLGGAHEILLTGASLGAFHAVNLAFRRADLFPVAIGLSGNYDPTTWHAWGEPGDAAYFNNPMHYVANLGGDHLEWLRSRLTLLLVCGQGMWEDTTGALTSTRALAGLLAGKGIRHELDLWGHDVPHDWPSWQRQIAHHLPRFC